jgi:hypothetical protein
MQIAIYYSNPAMNGQLKKTISTLKKQTIMNTISKVIATATAIIAFSTSSFAQATATASASATIITPISIVKNVDMNFGNVAVSASLAGTVVLAPAGGRTTGGAGGVTLPSTIGTVAGADFTVSGQASYTYAITLPTTATLTDGGSHTMIINTFTSVPATTGALSTGGVQDLKVGATLNVAAAQAAGVYTNSTAVPVTVNYN